MSTSQTSMDRATFLTQVGQSGLLTSERLEAIADQWPEAVSGKSLARRLVKAGLLTRFQAERLLAGRVGGFILGQYVILDQLGSGGMGRVYKAEHRAMRRTVALKILTPDLLKTHRAQDLFQREVQAVAQLNHPNIVTAFDANHVGDRYYLVLEYVDGPNLDQLVQEQGPLPVGQACHFIRQIAQGLQHAHQLGMVHRDIKPSNVLIHNGEGAAAKCIAKLSDFGLARLQDPSEEPLHEPLGTILTKENTVMGTPDFLSPEQARNLHKVDIRSDLYSLGCTFYYLLTGTPPYPGGSTLEKLVRHGTEMPRPIGDHRKDVPEAVTAIVTRLLAKNPAERFQTPEELARALEPFIQSGPTQWSSADRQNAEELDDSEPTRHDSDWIIDFPLTPDASALAGTVSADLFPTPVTNPHQTSLTKLSRTVYEEQRHRLWIAVGIAVGIMGALIGLAAVASFFLGD